MAIAADIPGKNMIALIEDDQPALVAIGIWLVSRKSSADSPRLSVPPSELITED